MKAPALIKGVFVERKNRFKAVVDIGVKVEAYVPSTGRLQELLYAGNAVYLEKVNSPSRKLKYSVFMAESKDGPIVIDTFIPNTIVFDGIKSGLLKIPDSENLRREYYYGNSRFDAGSSKTLVEVKSVTLREEGVAKFPDAPTSRGRKHIYELIEAYKEGFFCSLIFLCMMEKAKHFEANYANDPEFSKALRKAVNFVDVRAYTLSISENEISLSKEINAII